MSVLLLSGSNYSGSGSWLDESGNSNNATLNTGNILVNSEKNGIVFDGFSSWIFSDVAINNTWSISLWYKNTGICVGHIITQQMNDNNVNFFIGYYNDRFDCGFINNGIYYICGSNIMLNLNQWTNIQVTWNGTNLIIYTDNVLTYIVPLSGISVTSGMSYRIGGDNVGNYVTGEIGEIKIYNTVLTRSQVAINYNTSYITYLKTPFTLLINTPITFSEIGFRYLSYSTMMLNTIDSYTVNIVGWNDTINVDTLYIFDTNSKNLLTSTTDISGNNLDGYYCSFNYNFDQAQNYITICTTDNLSTGISHEITDCIVATPNLVLNLTSNSENKWGYYNTRYTHSWTITSYYSEKLVNYLNYYSTMKVYYADNNYFSNLTLIGDALLSMNNNQLNCSYSFTLNLLNNSNVLYFYFTYSDNPDNTNTFISDEYTYFDKSTLNFTLDHYNYYNNYKLISDVNLGIDYYIYYSKNSVSNLENQTFISKVVNNTFSLDFPQPDIGLYYLTVSNISNDNIRTSNDINVNITLPVYVNTINVKLDYNIGFFGLNTFNGIVNNIENIRIYYSPIIATQDSDIIEIFKTIPVINNAFSFTFDNTTLLLPTIYFYFTTNMDQIPTLDSFNRSNLITFYSEDEYLYLINLDNELELEPVLELEPESIPVINNKSIIIPEPLVQNTINLDIIKKTKVVGLIDQLNTFSVLLDNSYENIELNNTKNIINYELVNNNITFLYDPGFVLNTTFNIINKVTREIYEIIEASFMDPKL